MKSRSNDSKLLEILRRPGRLRRALLHSGGAPGVRPGRHRAREDHARRGHSDGAPAQSQHDRCSNDDPAERGRRDHAKACARTQLSSPTGNICRSARPASKILTYITVCPLHDYLNNNTEADIGLSYLIERGGKRQDRLQAQKDITAQTRSLVADNERGLRFKWPRYSSMPSLLNRRSISPQQDLKSFQQHRGHQRISNSKPAASAKNDYLMIKLQLLQFESDLEQAQLAQAQGAVGLAAVAGIRIRVRRLRRGRATSNT